MLKNKKLISLLLVALMVILPCSSVSAKSIYIKKSNITINNVTYQVSETYNKEGSKVVTVVGNNETNIVENNGSELIVSKINKKGSDITRYKIDQNYSISDNMALQSSGDTLSTPFWNYNYLYSTAFGPASWGTFWGLTSGDTHGSYSVFDEYQSSVRGYAENFMVNVQDICSQQWGAIGAMGFAAASAVAGAITAESGVGAIVGIVLAVGGAIGSVGFWVAAWTSSLNANYNFDQFKAEAIRLGL